MERIVNGTIFLTALGSGLMAGLFFIFSVCIMTALGRLAPASGIAAMQSINVTILNGIFLTRVHGHGGALPGADRRPGSSAGCRPAGLFVLAGSLLYLVGIIGVTMFVNVPMNDALMAVSPDSARRRGAVEGLPRQLDAVEPRPHGCRDRRTGRVRHRFPRLSESTIRLGRDPACLDRGRLLYCLFTRLDERPRPGRNL